MRRFRVQVVAVLAALLGNSAAFAADAAPSGVAKNPVASPLSSWEVQGGARFWVSSGKSQWDLASSALASRSTYDQLNGYSGELFARIESSANIFAKGNIGVGYVTKGNLNLENWAFLDAFNNINFNSNVSAPGQIGPMQYATIDVGYDVLKTSNYKLGPFVGYNYFAERLDDGFQGTQDSRWHSLRVGVVSEMKLPYGMQLITDFAYLPYVSFDGRFNLFALNFFPNWTTYYDQSGTGQGVQIEGILSYPITEQFRIGVGGRYWAMRTTDGSSVCTGCSGAHIVDPSITSKYNTERYGVFLQADYKFDNLNERAPKPNGTGPVPANSFNSVSSSMWSWTGGYVGVHAGGAWAQTSFSDPFGASIYGDKVTSPGFFAGGQVGYNYQSGHWVFGVEADANWLTADGTNTCLAYSGLFISANCHAAPDAFGTLAARAGYVFGSSGHTLLYAKGGPAWIHNQVDATVNAIFVAPPSMHETSQSYSKWGWMAGLGVEQAITPAWSLNLEYNFMDFGSRNVTMPSSAALDLNTFLFVHGPSVADSVRQRLNVVKLGLNYKLGADPATSWARPQETNLVNASQVTQTWGSGWQFDGGVRYWFSSGKFQWNKSFYSPAKLLVSRLTYDGLNGQSAELFARVDTPWKIFIKGNVGVGSISGGHENDEDWFSPPAFFAPYSNTTSDENNGQLHYATVDVGYNWLQSPVVKVGPFVGFNLLAERFDTHGCVQIALSLLSCLAPGDQTLIGTQDTRWQSLRVGVSTETVLFNRLKLTGDIAWLPYASFIGRDNHLLRDTTTFNDQSGHGRGVQLEATLSYFLSDHFELGVGGRYWAEWTNDTAYGGSPSKFSAERYGVFVQAGYHFDAPLVSATKH